VTEPADGGAPIDTSVLIDRQAQRRKRLRRTIVVIVAMIGIFALWLVWFSPVLSVQQVEVVGVDDAAAMEVAELADIPLGVPIARLDTDAPLQRVLTLQWLAAAEVRRGWPSQVVIAVQPRIAIARTEVDGKWLGVDSQGVAFLPPTPLSKGLIEVSGIGVALRAGVEVLESLPADLLARVSSVSATTRDDVELTLNSGSLVRWGSADEADFKSQVLTALLARRAQVYDVSAPELPTTFNERPKKP
jgi:cell division protein FtsQ